MLSRNIASRVANFQFYYTRIHVNKIFEHHENCCDDHNTIIQKRGFMNNGIFKTSTNTCINYIYHMNFFTSQKKRDQKWIHANRTVWEKENEKKEKKTKLNLNT